MALIFVDGFDHYSTADIDKKWTSHSGGISIGKAGRRLSGQLHTNGTQQNVFKTLPSSPTWIIGFAFQYAPITAATSLCALLDAGLTQCTLLLNVDGTLAVTRNGTGVTGGTSTVALSAGSYYYIEWKITISDSIPASSCVVRVSGVDAINVAAGQDLKATANASANQLRLGHISTTNSIVFDYDDLYVCDGSGTTNNDFLGDCRVDTQFPNADGTVTNFATSSGTTHYTLVDEATPNTTDYVDSAVIGDRDLYEFANLTALATSTVYGVQVSTAALKDDAGSRSIAVTAHSNGTNVDGATQALSTSQLYHSSIFETDSAAAQWNQSSVDAAQFGIVVAA